MRKEKIGIVVLVVFLVLSLMGLGYVYYLYNNKVNDYKSLETKYKDSEANYKKLKSNYDELNNKNNSNEQTKKEADFDYSSLKYNGKSVSDSVVDTIFETWEDDNNYEFFNIELLLSGKVLISVYDQNGSTKNQVFDKQLEGITDAIKLLYGNENAVYILTKSGNVYQYSLYDANSKKYVPKKIYDKSNIEKIMFAGDVGLVGITYDKNVVTFKQ